MDGTPRDSMPIHVRAPAQTCKQEEVQEADGEKKSPYSTRSICTGVLENGGFKGF